MSNELMTATSTASTMKKPFGDYTNFGVNYERETAEELVEKAGLNWEIELAPVNYIVGEETYSSKKRMIYRTDKPEIYFDTCGERWTAFQNADAIQTIMNFCDNSDGVATLQKVGSFKQGRIVWAIATTDKEFVLPGGDKVTGNILFINNHTFGNGTQVNLLTWRQVCSNGLTLPVNIKHKVMAHTASLTSEAITAVLEGTIGAFNEYHQNSELLAKFNISLDDVYTFLICNMKLGDISKFNFKNPSATDLNEQPKRVKQILSLYMGQGQGSDLISSYNTGWGLLQSVSEWTQYHSQKRGGLEDHISSLWLDSKANQNKDCYKQLVSLASR